MSKDNSDIDMTLFICTKSDILYEKEVDNFKKLAHVDHLQILSIIKKNLVSNPSWESRIFQMKKLHILRIQNKISKRFIDLCINNVLGVVNSMMIRTYCILD